jgi:hypothetical protein
MMLLMRAEQATLQHISLHNQEIQYEMGNPASH